MSDITDACKLHAKDIEARKGFRHKTVHASTLTERYKFAHDHILPEVYVVSTGGQLPVLLYSDGGWAMIGRYYNRIPQELIKRLDVIMLENDDMAYAMRYGLAAVVARKLVASVQ